MNFWTKFGYLLIILNYEYVETGISGYDYHAMPLGHTGILLFWDPKGAPDYETSYLKYHAVGNDTTADIFEIAFAKHGQYKLNSALIENTEYEIEIQDRYSEKELVQIKTGLKKNSVPEKPDFTWNLFRKKDIDFAELLIRIAWIPCGKERNCHGNEAGTHFAVRYKIRDLRRTFTLVQHTTDYVDIPYIYLGHIHEVTVSSINGDFQTDSDSQEIFHVPLACGPVHSVNVLTLSNTSIYVSWNKPRQSVPNVFLYQYFMYISTANESPYVIKRLWEPRPDPEGKFTRKLNGLTPNTNFTIFIVPYSFDEYKMPGSAYTFDYMIPAIQAINSTIAKPDFEIESYMNYGDARRLYYVNWIPCGETNDCKNMSPGSAFKVKIQTGNDEPKIVLEKVEHRTFIGIPCNYNISRFTVKSVNEFNQSSPSVSKTIRCEPY